MPQLMTTALGSGRDAPSIALAFLMLLIPALLAGLPQIAKSEASVPSFSVIQLPGNESGQARLAAHWSGDLPVRLVLGHRNQDDDFIAQQSDLLIDKAMTLIPLPEGFQATHYQFVDHNRVELTSPTRFSENYGWQAEFYGPGAGGSLGTTIEYNGDLYVASSSHLGGKKIHGVGRWDGTSWHALEGTDEENDIYYVRTFEVFQGDLYIGGGFTSAGGQPATGLAKWDGAVLQGIVGLEGGFSSFPFGPTDPVVETLQVFEGELIAAGDFPKVNGQPAGHMARWTGTEWLLLENTDGSVGIGTDADFRDMTTFNGHLIVGGDFESAGNVTTRGVARWKDGIWSRLDGPYGHGAIGVVHALTVYGNNLIVGGTFGSAGGVQVNKLARWTGAHWLKFSQGGEVGMNNDIYSLAVFDNQLIVGGFFHRSTGVHTMHISRWDGLNWQALHGPEQGVLGNGTNARVFGLTPYNGKLVATGNFTRAGFQPVNRIALWDGSRWTRMPESHLGGIEDEVFAVEVYQGELYAAGNYLHAGGSVVNYIARWNGHLWSPLGPWMNYGTNWKINALKTYDGELILGGQYGTAGGQPMYNIARWNGSTFLPLDGPDGIGVNGPVHALEVHNGDLIVGGEFQSAGGRLANRIARWNSGQWSRFNVGGQIGVVGTVFAIESHADSLFIGGGFSSVGGQYVGSIAQWKNNTWHSLPGPDGSLSAGGVYALLSVNDLLFVGGQSQYYGGVHTGTVGIWTGTEWLATGVSEFSGTVRDLLLNDGSILAAGDLRISGSSSRHLIRWDGQEWTGTWRNNQEGMNYPAYALKKFNGRVYVGGDFTSTGGVANWKLGSFDWEPSTLVIESAEPHFENEIAYLEVTAIVSGILAAPAFGRVTFESDQGQSCTTTSVSAIDEQAASSTCLLPTTSGGAVEINGKFSASASHMDSLAEPYNSSTRWISETTIISIDPSESQVSGQPYEVQVSLTSGFQDIGIVTVSENSVLNSCTAGPPDYRCTLIAGSPGLKQIRAEYAGNENVWPSSDVQTYMIGNSTLSFSPAPLDFGSVPIGQHSESEWISIHNSESSIVEINSVSTASPPFFDASNGTCGPTPFTLEPEQSCTIGYTFQAQTGKHFTEAITVESNASDGPHVFFLRGTGQDTVFSDRFFYLN